jgi:hypothetical protein
MTQEVASQLYWGRGRNMGSPPIILVFFYYFYYIIERGISSGAKGGGVGTYMCVSSPLEAPPKSTQSWHCRHHIILRQRAARGCHCMT